MDDLVPRSLWLPYRVLALLIIVSFPLGTTLAQEAQDFVGQRLPHLELRTIYNGSAFLQSQLRGHRWILVLVQIDSKKFREYIPFYESLHRSLEEGGPVLLAYGRQQSRQIRRALKKLDKMPSFPISSDFRLIAHKRLRPGASYPYYYLIDSAGIVEWQGSDSPETHQRLREFARHKTETSRPESQAKRDSPLPADYRDQVARSLERKDTAEQVRLLRMAYKGDSLPQQEILQELWNRLDETLAKGLAEIEERLTKKRYSSARQRLLTLRQDLAEFPPAASLEKVWHRVAGLEGSRWYSRAIEAHNKGDLKTARNELERILKYYEGTEIGKKARELLDSIDQ